MNSLWRHASKKMMKFKITDTVIVYVVVAILAVVFLRSAIVSNQKKAALPPLVGVPVGISPGNMLPPMTSLSGRVVAVQGSEFAVQTDIRALPGENPLPTARTVTVAGETLFTIARQTAAAKQYQAQMRVQQKALLAIPVALASTSSTRPAPVAPPKFPTPPLAMFTYASGTLADVHVGDVVNLTAATDIRSAASFTATAVEIDR